MHDDNGDNDTNILSDNIQQNTSGAGDKSVIIIPNDPSGDSAPPTAFMVREALKQTSAGDLKARMGTSHSKAAMDAIIDNITVLSSKLAGKFGAVTAMVLSSNDPAVAAALPKVDPIDIGNGVKLPVETYVNAATRAAATLVGAEVRTLPHTPQPSPRDMSPLPPGRFILHDLRTLVNLLVNLHMLSELEQGIHAPPKFGGKPRKKFMDAYNRFFSDQPKDFIDKVADYLRGLDWRLPCSSVEHNLYN